MAIKLKCPYFEYETKKIEEWLDLLAKEKGYFLNRIRKSLYFFNEDDPKEIYYRVVPINIFFNLGRLPEVRDQYLDSNYQYVCEEYGYYVMVGQKKHDKGAPPTFIWYRFLQMAAVPMLASITFFVMYLYYLIHDFVVNSKRFASNLYQQLYYDNASPKIFLIAGVLCLVAALTPFIRRAITKFFRKKSEKDLRVKQIFRFTETILMLILVLSSILMVTIHYSKIGKRLDYDTRATTLTIYDYTGLASRPAYKSDLQYYYRQYQHDDLKVYFLTHAMEFRSDDQFVITYIVIEGNDKKYVDQTLDYVRKAFSSFPREDLTAKEINKSGFDVLYKYGQQYVCVEGNKVVVLDLSESANATYIKNNPTAVDDFLQLTYQKLFNN